MKWRKYSFGRLGFRSICRDGDKREWGGVRLRHANQMYHFCLHMISAAINHSEALALFKTPLTVASDQIGLQN